MSNLGTYRLRVAFAGGYPLNLFRIGISTIGSGDWLGHAFSVGYDGPYDDVTNHVTDFTLTRGRGNDTDPLSAGNLDVTLYDTNGFYNPKNSSSPLYGKIKPLLPCLFEIQVGGVWYTLFRGWLDEESARTDFGEKAASIRFTDMLIWLDRAAAIVIPATGPGTTGGAISLILDAIGWTDPAYRSLQAGIPITNFEATGQEAGTALITKLLEADRGTFFPSRNGVATFKDRHEVFRVDPYATFDVADAVIPGISLSSIRNRSRITREVAEPAVAVEQVAVDQASVNEFGYSDWPTISSPYFISDAQALTAAEYLVWLGRGFVGNIWTLAVQEGTSAEDLANYAQADILKKITVSTPAASGDYFIQQIKHSGAGGQVHKMSLVLSEAPTEEAFIIGHSTIGSTEDVLVPG